MACSADRALVAKALAGEDKATTATSNLISELASLGFRSSNSGRAAWSTRVEAQAAPLTDPRNRR